MLTYTAQEWWEESGQRIESSVAEREAVDWEIVDIVTSYGLL